MDWQNIGWLAVFVLVGGAIAYGADHLGRRMGKKRLSLAGLRPRHTAAVITVLAGMITALLTIILMLVTSTDLRTALLQGTQLIRDRDALLVQIDKGKGELNAMDGRFKLAKNRAVALETQRSRLQAQIRTLNAGIKTASELAATQRTKLASLTGQIAAKTKLIAAKTAELQARLNDVAGLKTNLANLKQNYKIQNSDLQTAYDQNKRLSDVRDQLTRQIDKKNKEAQDLNNLLQGLKEQRDQLQSQLETTQGKLAKAATDLSDTQKQVTNAQEKLATATATLKFNIAASRTQRLIYNTGDEVARVFIDPKLTSSQAAERISSLLVNARGEAKGRGAGLGQIGTYAGLYDRETPRGTVTVEEQMRAIVTDLTNDFSPLVVVAYSTFNTFTGEPVLLDLKKFPNTYVYKAGEVIAETRVDGRQDEADIRQELIEFLTSDVRTKAIKDEMLPRIGAEQTLGAVTDKELLDLAKKIHLEGRNIRVLAAAKDDTRRGDTLELAFKIR